MPDTQSSFPAQSQSPAHDCPGGDGGGGGGGGDGGGDGGDGGAGGGEGEQQYEVVDPSGAPLESQLHMSLRHTDGLEPQYVPGSSLAVQSSS